MSDSNAAKSRTIAIGYAVTAALGVALAGGCGDRNVETAKMPPPTVLVSTPVTRKVANTREFTARTQAKESVDVKPRVTGYLKKIKFKDGDDVKEGDVLFEIDDRPYKAALDQAEAALETAKAALVKNTADYQIAVNIRKQNPAALSQEDLNKALGAKDESKGNVDKTTADLENAKLNYGWCKVTAPITGRTNRHFIDEGNLITQDSTTLTNIVSIRPIWAYFDVDENTMREYERQVEKGELKPVRTTEVPVEMALAGDKTRTFPIKGVIDFVSNQVDPNTGSIRVRGSFANEKGDILAGQFGRVRLPIGAPHEALLVADTAVGTNQGQRYILVLNDKDEVEYRAVDVGQLHNGLREVMKTRDVVVTGPDGQGENKTVEVLKPTDRVIVDGLQRVRPGTKVEPRTVDMVTMLPVAATAKDSPKDASKEPSKK